jgi:hypothetical protein
MVKNGMSIDAKIIAKRLKSVEPKRSRLTLYLDTGLVRSFQHECRKMEISSNKTLEELMKEFIESAKDPKKK